MSKSYKLNSLIIEDASILLDERFEVLEPISFMLAVPVAPLLPVVIPEVEKFALCTAKRMGPLLFLKIEGDKHFFPPS